MDAIQPSLHRLAEHLGPHLSVDVAEIDRRKVGASLPFIIVVPISRHVIYAPKLPYNGYSYGFSEVFVLLTQAPEDLHQSAERVDRLGNKPPPPLADGEWDAQFPQKLHIWQSYSHPPVLS